MMCTECLFSVKKNIQIIGGKDPLSNILEFNFTAIQLAWHWGDLWLLTILNRVSAIRTPK